MRSRFHQGGGGRHRSSADELEESAWKPWVVTRGSESNPNPQRSSCLKSNQYLILKYCGVTCKTLPPPTPLLLLMHAESTGDTLLRCVSGSRGGISWIGFTLLDFTAINWFNWQGHWINYLQFAHCDSSLKHNLYHHVHYHYYFYLYRHWFCCYYKLLAYIRATATAVDSLSVLRFPASPATKLC